MQDPIGFLHLPLNIGHSPAKFVSITESFFTTPLVRGTFEKLFNTQRNDYDTQ